FREMNKLFPSSPALADGVSTIPIARANGETAFGVYVHWPFCLAKCPYCDFNSHVRHKPVDQARFSKAFRREMETLRERTGPRTEEHTSELQSRENLVCRLLLE